MQAATWVSLGAAVLPLVLAWEPTIALSRATAPSSTSSQADRLSADWKRLVSPSHGLTVVGNASERELRAGLESVVQFRSALRYLMPTFDLSSEVPVTIVVFRDERSFHRFKPRDQRGRIEANVGGYFTAWPDATYMVLPAGGRGELRFRVLLHEYMHYVTYRNVRMIPVWLNEGLAEFYSTFTQDYKDGRSALGLLLQEHLRILRAGAPIRLRDLLSDEQARKILRERRRVEMFYSQSWALTHYLQMDDLKNGTTKLESYIRALERGQSVEDAVRASFGRSVEELEEDLSRYVRQYSFSGALLPERASEIGDVTVERLRESEATYVRGDLLVRLGALPEAEREIEASLQAAPTFVPTQISMARLRVQQDRVGEAVQLLEGAVTSDPASFAAPYYLASAYAADDRFAEALGASERAAKLIPASAAAWFQVSLNALALARDSTSDEALAQVLKLNSSPDWRTQRAYKAFETGRYAITVRDAREVLDTQGWGFESAPYLAFLAALAYSHMDQPTEAQAILAEAAPVVRPGSWQEHLLNFMQNRTDADTVIRRARDGDQRTEAYTYAGIRAALAGQVETARRHLEWVKSNGSRYFVEYDLAVAYLKKLGRAATGPASHASSVRACPVAAPERPTDHLARPPS